MRLAAIAVATFLILLLTPGEAPARKIGLGPLAGPLKSVLRGAIRVRPYSYRSRARYARRPAPARAAIAQQQRATAAQTARLGALGALAAPVAFWPNAPQDVFDYVLAREDGLWAQGYGAVITSMFAQPSHAGDPRDDQKTGNVAAGDQATQSEQTVGAASPAAAASNAPVCPEDRASHAEAITNWLRDKLALPADHRALTQLRAALTKIDDEITAGCPREVPVTLPDRLRAMQDRLWTLRVAATNLRASLQDFNNELTPEQKAKLDAPQQAPARESRRSRRGRSAEATDAIASAGLAGRLCYAYAQRAPQWPAEQIARAVHPNREQQQRLAAVSETSTKMGMMMMGACPQKVAVTPQDRLNVALDWADNLLVATANIAVAVDDFYGSLSDEQKAKLDTLRL